MSSYIINNMHFDLLVHECAYTAYNYIDNEHYNK